MTRMHAPVALLFSSVWLITFGVLQCSAGRTYVYKPREVNFKQAQEQCKEYGMVVAIADTVEDIEAMNSYLEPLGSVEAWLGMVYTGNGKQFSWVNGESVTAHRWDVTADDEPDNLATQKCAVWRRRDNQWDSRECDNVYHLPVQYRLRVAGTSDNPVTDIMSIDLRNCATKSASLTTRSRDHSFLYTTYSLYLKDSMFDQQAAATVTSNTNIECAVSCQTLDHCVYFSHQRALHQCLLYTSTSTPSATRATEGQQIWISD